jgi:hypothetical protein
MPRKDLLALLKGGDQRSIGGADQVAASVAKKHGMFPNLIAGLRSTDPLVRMRAADAAEKVTRKNHELLQPYQKDLLELMVELMAQTKEQEMRWHWAAMISRLRLSARERQHAVSLLKAYLEDRSSLAKTSALQGLADLAQQDSSLRSHVVELLHESTRNGTPAMKARCRKLLLQQKARDAITPTMHADALIAA